MPSSSESNAVVVSDNEEDVVMIGRDDVSNYNPEQILPESPKTIQEIRTWLQPTSYDLPSGEYRKHLASHVAGTGIWLTSSATYKEWLQSVEHGLLWIKGIPGSGKSVTAANLIHEIAEANPGCPVLFFFFRQIIEANHEPQALLRDWMDQILDYSPPLQKKLKTYVESRRSLDSLSMEDLWRHLRMALSGLSGKAFCVADALDEIDQGNSAFLQALGALGQWRPEKIKVLITSRPVASVEGPLRTTPCLPIRLKENLVDIDIATYVQFALSNSFIPQIHWQTIANAVPGRANGLFLYAKLAMDAFLEPGADIDAVLSQLPADLNALYTDLLSDHGKRSGVPASVQHLILQSVTHTTRPLRLLELAEMIRVHSPDGSRRDLKATKELIRAACGPLLEILPDETVSVIHHSFTEYLKGTTRSDDGSGYPVLQMGSTHTQLALACLHYLQDGCLDAVKIRTDNDKHDEDSDSDYHAYSAFLHRDKVHKEEVQLRLKHPFFEYAASNWHHHISRSEASGHDQTQVNIELHKLFGDNQRMKAWLQIKWPAGATAARLVTRLHIAAMMGLVSHTKELIEMMEVDALDFDGKTPLWWASEEGHATVIRELIAAGANPDKPDSTDGYKPLHKAAIKNHHEAVKALLEAGVNPLTPKTRDDPGLRCGGPTSVGEIPLMYACRAGHLETVEAFLPFLKDIDTVHHALAWAAENGRSRVVARILQYPGVDVNVDVSGMYPISRACGGGDVETIRILLQAGANVNHAAEGEKADSPRARKRSRGVQNGCLGVDCLYRICGQAPENGHVASKFGAQDLQTVFSLLVQAGIDINQRDISGRTALHGAASSPIMTRLLLNAGADANATDIDGYAPLHNVQCVDSMALLVEQGHANIDLPAADGQTPLVYMLARSFEEMATKLLEYGPNCNAIDKQGNSALHAALRSHGMSQELVKALLAAGADPNIRNHEGMTPIFLLRNGLRYAFKIVDLLLEAGADINAVDKSGATILFHQVSFAKHRSDKDPHKDLRDLVDRGASIFIRDFQGRTCLHEVVANHDYSHMFGSSSELDLSRFGFLLDLGLDVKATDHAGNGLLHEIAKRLTNHEPRDGPKIVGYWEHLVHLGLDLEQRNHAGRTPLHIMCTASNHSGHLSRGEKMPIDFVISRTKNLDLVDHDGATPLHLAVMSGEFCAKKLVDAGANPLAITNEGLTPLHLASRCRQSNCVGLLLDALSKRSQGSLSETNKTAQTEKPEDPPSSQTAPLLRPVVGVDASTFDKEELTPLFYACQSGRPETVALLLEAGADVGKGKVFEAILGFEAEDILWKGSRQSKDEMKGGWAIPIKIQDTHRRNSDLQRRVNPHVPAKNETTRLEEIIEMLIKYGADTSQLDCKFYASPIHVALKDNRDYTAACLTDARRRHLDDTESERHGKDVIAFHAIASSSRNASIQALRDCRVVEPGDDNQIILRHLLSRREYHVAEELFHLGTSFLPTAGNQLLCNLAVLIHSGYASLVDKVGTLEAESRLENGHWHAFGDKAKPGLWFANRDISQPSDNLKNPFPFLLQAMMRDLPNMDVVRLLVEKFKVDIDEPNYNHHFIGDSYKIVPIDSPLHHVAMSLNWWHVHQALPYLLKAGAKMNTRNCYGQTPLHVALGGDERGYGIFHNETARILIEAGADVNAVDSKGQSCLGRAQHNIEMIRLLIKHGATVTADAIFAAIDAKNTQVLEALLSGGIDANIRREKPSESSTNKKRNRGLYQGIAGTHLAGIELHQIYPLYYAAKDMPIGQESNDEKLRKLDIHSRLTRILLDHNADPFAKFLKPKKTVENESEEQAMDATVDTPTVEVPQGYEECTILHEMLMNCELTAYILHRPGLDVNHRDAKGRSLLHAACGGIDGADRVLRDDGENEDGNENTTIFQQLLLLGAELEARDHFGRNVLHHMIGTQRDRLFDRFRKSFAYTLERAPHLVNQADGNGETPLHYAIVNPSYGNNVEIAEMLLSAGADAMAVDDNECNALHKLAKCLDTLQKRALFQELVKRGAGINSRNSDGETPLFAFSKRPRIDRSSTYAFYPRPRDRREDLESAAVPMLQELGADFFTRDNKGRGLLHVAASGDVERFKVLRALGLDAMLEDNAHQTAIDVAAACGNKEVLELFEKKD